MLTINRFLLLLSISVVFMAVKVTQFKQKHSQYFETFPVNKTPVYAATLTEDNLLQTIGTPTLEGTIVGHIQKKCQTVVFIQNLLEPPNNITCPSLKSGHLLYAIQNDN